MKCFPPLLLAYEDRINEKDALLQTAEVKGACQFLYVKLLPFLSFQEHSFCLKYDICAPRVTELIANCHVKLLCLVNRLLVSTVIEFRVSNGSFPGTSFLIHCLLLS